MILAIDIGGTNTKMALVEAGGLIRHSNSCRTNIRSEVDFIDSVLFQIDSYITTTKEIKGIGLSAPAVVGNNLVDPANLPINGSYPLVQILEKRFDLPVSLIKDSQAFLIGEVFYGSAIGYSNVALISIGTGLGSALMINGQIYNGSYGLGSEIGHTILIPNGRSCSCGKKGCAEAYISARAIQKNYAEGIKKIGHTNLHTLNNSAHDVYLLACSNNKQAKDALKQTGKYLGILLANLIHTCTPDVVILSGGVMESSTSIIEPAINTMNQMLLEPYKNKTKVIRGSKNYNAALLGAAHQAQNKIINYKIKVG